MKTLLVFPTAREASVLRGRGHPLVAGAGSRSGAAVAARLREERPDLVVLGGWCGALDPSFSPGTVVLGRDVLAPGEAIIAPDRFLIEEVRDALHRQGFPFIYSRLLTIDHPAATQDEKRDLWNEHGAGAVDLETYHVAQACRAARIPWLAVRTVIDTSKQSLPKALADWSEEGDERAGLTGAIARPWEWPSYARLARNYRPAKRALTRALPAVVRAAKNAKTVETLDLVSV